MTDARLMRRALELARLGLGRTAPNPAVGCVIARTDTIIGEGYHRVAGGAHAEIDALRSADSNPKGATAYVTLEPCDHRGRTGPCTEALIAAGISRVVVGTIDPNPEVGGRGITRLKAAGIRVDFTTTALREEAEALIAGFRCWVRTGRPRVTLKVASTLDGRIATATGDSRWVTSPPSRRDVHRLRDEFDAICVGAGTVRADDPALTTRLESGAGQDGMRVIVCASLDLPPHAKVLAEPAGAPTVIVTALEGERAEALRRRGIEVWATGPGPNGVDLARMLEMLGRRGITSVLVEGGKHLASSLLAQRLVDSIRCYIAPKVIGDDGIGWAGPLGIRKIDESIGLSSMRVHRFGDDVCIEGDCVYGDR